MTESEHIIVHMSDREVVHWRLMFGVWPVGVTGQRIKALELMLVDYGDELTMRRAELERQQAIVAARAPAASA